MCSKKQRLTNAQNALKSTGPTSADGKTVASRNSLKHGLSANAPIVLDEKQDEFDAHAQRIRDEFRPTTPMETVLVDRIVDQSWKIRRIPDAEREAYWQCERLQREDWNAIEEDQDDGVPITPGKVMSRSIQCEQLMIERVQGYEQRIERSILAAMRALRQLRKDAKGAAQVLSDDDVTKMQNEPISHQESASPAPLKLAT